MNSDLGSLAPISTSRKRVKIPEIDGLDEPKPLLHRSIEVVEHIFWRAAKPDDEEEESWLKIDFVADQSAEHVRNELLELIRAPYRSDYMNQSVAFWRLLDRKEDNILMFCRERSPIANVLFQMVRGSRLSEDFLNGYICESDFPCMTASAGVLSGASLRICDARDPGVFLRVLFDAYPYFDCAICDWNLAPEEINAVSRMTKDSPIAFLCPQ